MMPEEPDEELEALMGDIYKIAMAVRSEGLVKSEPHVRAFALRLLRERQMLVNGTLDEVIANLAAGGSGGVEMVRAMRARGR